MIKIVVEHHIDTTKRGTDYLFDTACTRVVKTYFLGILVMNRITYFTSELVKDSVKQQPDTVGFKTNGNDN